LPRYSRSKIGKYFKISDQTTGDAPGRTIKGKALEDLIYYIFEKVPGIPFIERNQQNVFQTEEIDLAFWNDKTINGLHFLPNIILVECKNWSRAVDTDAVSYFKNKIDERGLDFGVLVAANGITGDPNILSRANFILNFGKF
jgi:hypothetical protein